MSIADVIVWEASGDSAAALRQLNQDIGEGQVTVEKVLDYWEICESGVGNPFAICLWEVNLSNWETRAEQLAEFTRALPNAVVAIAASDLPEAVIELLQELGAPLVVRDRLEARWVLQLAARWKKSRPDDPSSWRTIVQTPIAWLDGDPRD
jgi:hypothetical protein